MRNRRLVIVFILAYCLIFTKETIQAQVDYIPLKSNGIIPLDFVVATADKYKSEVEEIESEKVKRKDRKYQKDFALGSNFGVDEMLLNGMVLYNDSMSLYVHKVAQEILKDDKELYSKLRFYTMKDATVNAFTTDNGIIFVTTGLLARLENEAQLAFILCHEMSHYILKHGKNNYVKKQKIINGDIGSGKISMLDKVHTLFGFSKKAEYEADEKGLELFLKTPYNKEAAINAFDILKKSDEPMGNYTYDFKSLEGSYYIFPEKLFISELKVKKEEDDSFHTHPAAIKRQFVIEDLLENKSIAGDDFIVDKERFFQVQYMARMEMLLSLVTFGDFVAALHNANYLMKVYTDNNFVRNIHSYCLYSLSKAALDNDKSDYILKDDFGNLSETNFFIKKMGDKELAVLASRDIYLNYKKDTTNTFALDLFKNQLIDLMKKEFMYLSFKLDTPLNVQNQFFKDSLSIEKEYGDKLTESQKQRKLKRLSKKQEVEYYLYGFFDLIDSDPVFEKIFKATEKVYKKEVVSKEMIKLINLSDREYMQKGYSVGIDSMILMEPGLRKVSYRKHGRSNQNKLKENKLELDLVSIMQANAALLEMDYTIMKERGEDGLTTESYNVRNLLISVLVDRASTSFRKQIVFNDQFKKPIFDEYGTYNLGLFNITNIKYPGDVKAEEVLLIFLYGIGVPFVINSALPKNYMRLNFVVINLDNGAIPFNVNYKFRGRYKKSKLDSHMYHILNQLKSKRL